MIADFTIVLLYWQLESGSRYVLESRPMEGGRRAGRASDGDEFEGVGPGASFHADQHGEPGIDVLESRTMEGGRRAERASDGDEFEGVGPGASFHADQHEQPCLDIKIPRPQ